MTDMRKLLESISLRDALIIGALLTAMGAPASAATPKKADSTTVGSTELEDVQISAKPAIIERCETCHGIDGNSLHFDFPKLAGQRSDYLAKQMRDIKSGSRKVDVMVPIISLLKDEQIKEVADYFASVPLVPGTSTNPGAARVGKKIFDLGVPYRMVAQCSACHGKHAEGRVDPGLVQDGFGGFPALNGQHAVYTIKQLKEFRTAARNNDFNDMMHNLAKHMSDSEIELVAEYLAGMEPPPPVLEETQEAIPAPPQVAACMVCHGPSGNSPSPAFPKLAGQQSDYLIKQLTDIRTGDRVIPMMTKAVSELDTTDIEVIADYYAAQPPTTTPSTAEPETVEAGMNIFFEGTDGVLACYSCHNFDGRGTEDFGLSPGGYPMISGQYSTYLIKQLTDFKARTRKNDHIKAMHNIAREMSKDEIEAVAAFLQEMKL